MDEERKLFDEMGENLLGFLAAVLAYRVRLAQIL
jgi:hypothetical protein